MGVFLTTALVVMWGASLALSYYLREDDEGDTDRANHERGSTTVAQEGDSVPIVIGKARVRKTNVILYGGDQSFSDYMKESFEEYPDNDNAVQFHIRAQIAVCARPIISVNVFFGRFWVGDELILPSASSVFTETVRKETIWGGPGLGGGVGRVDNDAGNGFWAGSGLLKALPGDALQLDSDGFGHNMVWFGPRRAEGRVGGTITPSEAHRGGLPGICSFDLYDFYIGERPSMPGFSVEMTVWPDYATLIESRVNNQSNGDANPMAALYMILTDKFIGMGIDGNLVDTDSFEAAGNTLNTEANGFSYVSDGQVTGEDIVDEIMKQIDGVLYIDPETQLFAVNLVRDDYTPAFLQSFSDSNVLEVVDFKETLWTDTYNQVRVEFEDRAADYGIRYAVAQNGVGAAQEGQIKEVVVRFRGCKTAALANRLAHRELYFYSTPQTTVTLRVNREANNLRPGDVIRWSCSDYTITDLVLRIHDIHFGTKEDGAMILYCTRDKYAEISTSFSDPDRHWFDNYGITPEAPTWDVGIEAPYGADDGTDYDDDDGGSIIDIIGVQTDAPTTYGNVYAGTPTTDGGISYFRTGEKPRRTTPNAEVDTAYSRNEGGYYDDATGIIVKNISDKSVIQSFATEDIQAGRNQVLVNGEFISYESATDLTTLAVRSSDSASAAAATTSVTITKPTGAAEGDLLVAVINCADVAPTTFPAGWAHVGNSPYFVDEAQANHCAVMIKRAGASEPANYQFDRDTGATYGMSGAMVALEYGDIDWVSFNGEYVDHPTGNLPTEFTGYDPGTSEMYLTALTLTQAYQLGGPSTIAPYNDAGDPAFTELEDLLHGASVSAHTYLAYSTDVAEGVVQSGIAISGVTPLTAHTMVTIGVKSIDEKRYSLDNVWRGLFDTVPEAHAVGDGVFFLSGAKDAHQRLPRSPGCGEELIYKTQSFDKAQRELRPSVATFKSVAYQKRALRPIRPTQFTVYDPGSDAIASTPEIDYAYDVERPQDLTDFDAISGQLEASAGKDDTALDVWTNDLRADWLRRRREKTCAPIVRGDASDQPYNDGDTTRIQIEGRGYGTDTWVCLSSVAADGSKTLRSAGDVVPMGRMRSGAGKLRVCTYAQAESNSEELASLYAEEIDVDVHSARELLTNRDFRARWDLTAASAGAYGDGGVAVGSINGARGWTDITTSVATVSFEVFTTASLYQGADDEGYAFVARNTSSTGPVAAEIEQVFPVPYKDTEDSEIFVGMWVYIPNEVDYAIDIETLDANGTQLDLQEVAGGRYATATGLAGDWEFVTNTLTGMSASARSIRITIAVYDSVGDPVAVSKASVVMGRQILDDQLTDGAFDATLATNWNPTGTWASSTGSGGLNPIHGNSNNMALCTADGALYQDVTLPADVSAGDYVRLQTWIGHTTTALDTINTSLYCRDGVGTIATASSGATTPKDPDQWDFVELYLKIPQDTTTIRVEYDVDIVGTSAAVDEAELTFIKSEAIETRLEWRKAVVQPKPATPGEFAELCGDLRCAPSHIFRMEDGSTGTLTDDIQGQVMRGTRGTADTDYRLYANAVGLYDADSDTHWGQHAVELCTPTGTVAGDDLTLGDMEDQSICVYMHYRLVQDETGDGLLILKGADHGQFIDVGENQDKLHWNISYDGTTSRLYLDVYLPGIGHRSARTWNVDDAGWHWAAFKIDLTNGMLEAFGDGAAGIDSDIAANLATLYSNGLSMSNNEDPFRLGSLAGADVQGTDYPAQISYLAILRGPAAEAFTRTHGQAMWSYGTDPSAAGHSETITYTRANRIGTQIGENYGHVWSGSTYAGGSPQIPLAFGENYSDDNQLGLAVYEGAQNLLAYGSKLDVNWTTVNSTVDANALVSERGFLEMDVVRPTGATDHVYRDITGLTASTTYRITLWASRDTGLGTGNATVEVTQNDLATTLLAQTLTNVEADNPRMYTWTFTTQGGQTSTRLKLTPGGATSDCAFQGITVTEGAEFRGVIYGNNENATLETSSDCIQSLQMTESELCSPDEGSLVAAYVQPVVDTSEARLVVGIYTNTGDDDNARLMRIATTGTQDSVTHDDGGTLDNDTPSHAALTADEAYSRTMKWRAKTQLASNATYYLQDIIGVTTQSANGGGAYTATQGHNYVYIGGDRAGGQILAGSIQSLQIFSHEVRNPQAI